MPHHGRPTTWHWRLLGRLGTDVRIEETRIAAFLFAYCFLIGAFQFAAKSIRQSSFVDSLGWTQLPFVYLAVAVTAWPVLKAWNRLAARTALERFVPRSTLGVIATLLVFWWLYGHPWPWARFLFYVWISIVTLLVFSQFWSWASHLLDPRQARRLFAFILSGALIGGVVGGQVAALVTRFADARATLLAAAALLALTLPLCLRIRHLSRAGALPGLGPDEGGSGSTGTLREIWRSTHLRSVAALMFVSIMVAEITDLQFNWVVEQATERLDQRTMIFGNFFSVMALTSFALQLTLTSRIQRHLGVGVALRALPATMAAGTAALLGAAAVLPQAVIGVLAALKVSEGAVRYSLDQGTRELLYLPVPQQIRPRVKATIDVLLQRVARAVAAILLFTVTFGWISPIGVSWVVLLLVAAWIVLTFGARRSYVASFREGLLQRRIDPAERLDPSDVATLEVLVAALGSTDSGEVLQAIELLQAQGRSHLVSPLLLHHDSAEVRRRTLELLRRSGRSSSRDQVERLIGDDDPAVRAEAIRAFAVLAGDDASNLLASRLSDPDPRVRAAAVVGMLQLAPERTPETGPEARPRAGAAAEGELLPPVDARSRERALAALDRLLADADPAVRRVGARALGGAPAPGLTHRLMTVLQDPDPEVVRAAVRAVRHWSADHDLGFLFLPVLVSLLRERRLKLDVREALVAAGDQALPVLSHFLCDPREYFWVRLALPKTIALFRAEPARDALLEALPCGDTAVDHAIIGALSQLTARSPRLRFPLAKVEEHIREQARRHLRACVRLAALTKRGDFAVRGARVVWLAPRPRLLVEDLLIDRMTDHAKNVFSLLSLVHPHGEIMMAYERLKSDDPRVRNHALEFVDQTLRPAVRRQVMAVIDDVPLEERLALAASLFHIATASSRVEALRGLIQAAEEGDVWAHWLGAAALAVVAQDPVPALAPLVAHCADHSEDPLLRETAAWATAHRLTPALGW